jgi:hypothetical protein
MTLDEFRQSLTATDAPAGLTLALAGLWWDAKGNWTRAQNPPSRTEGSWVHAYHSALMQSFRNYVRTDDVSATKSQSHDNQV